MAQRGGRNQDVNDGHRAADLRKQPATVVRFVCIHRKDARTKPLAQIMIELQMEPFAPHLILGAG